MYQKSTLSPAFREEGADCACRQNWIIKTRYVMVSDAPFLKKTHHLRSCHSVVRLFHSPGDSSAPSLPPLTSRRMRESLTRFPRWDKGFTSACSWTLMIQPLMAAVPNAYLLFKAQSLPPPMVWFTVGELMEMMGKEQGFICEFLQSKFQMFDHVCR